MRHGGYFEDQPDDDALEPETPGERLLYALGQLHRLCRAGELAVQPADFGVEQVARLIGVWPKVQLATVDGAEQHFHFANEVLYVCPFAEFPWRLLGIWEWAEEREAEDPSPTWAFNGSGQWNDWDWW